MMGALVISATLALQSETLTMVASYPSPMGVYRSLVATGNASFATKTGQVAIGATASSSDPKLYVNGNASINGSLATKYFNLATGATNKYVLTSDASGNGTWQSASGQPWMEVTGQVWQNTVPSCMCKLRLKVHNTTAKITNARFDGTTAPNNFGTSTGWLYTPISTMSLRMDADGLGALFQSDFLGIIKSCGAPGTWDSRKYDGNYLFTVYAQLDDGSFLSRQMQGCQ
jgi:hypothetical protein